MKMADLVSSPLSKIVFRETLALIVIYYWRKIISKDLICHAWKLATYFFRMELLEIDQLLERAS